MHSRQNSPLFWKLHDFIYDHQSQMTTINFQSKIDEKAQEWGGPDFDPEALRARLVSKDTAAIVQSDVNFGWSQEISGTPTLFINGERLDGASTAEQLEKVLKEQLTHTEIVSSNEQK